MTTKNSKEEDFTHPEYTSFSDYLPTRFLPASLLILGLILAISLDLHQALNLGFLGEYHYILREFINNHKALSLFLFCLLYMSIVAISLPGASFLTLSSGYLFGALYGGIASHFSATLGAVLIFLATRTALGDCLRNRTSPFLEIIAQGFKRDEYGYLLLFRLIPLYPFFVMNLAPAFLGARIKPFIITTFLGIIPGTYILACVGKGLGLFLQQGDMPKTDLLSEPEIILPLMGGSLLIVLHMVYKMRKARKLRQEVSNNN